MPDGLLPAAAPPGHEGSTDPLVVVEAFLAALADDDVDTAASLVDDDISYVNVGLPEVRGRSEMDKVLALLARPGAGFEVYLHAIAADGPVVLTERTDVLIIGPLRLQFWVWGRFDVRDGKIVLWRDSFDVVDILRGTVRGIVGLALPGLLPVAPLGPDAAPGR